MQSTTLRRGGKTKPFVSSLRFAIARRSSGWPRIAMVISVDLPIVGRRRPGDTLRFRRGYGRDGRGALPGCRARAHRMVTRLEPVPDGPGIDLGSLYAGNLISGSSAA